MKTIFLSIILLATTFLSAQTLSDDFKMVLQIDSTERFKILLDKADKNACYETGNSSYTLLAITIKLGATNCFNHLLAQQADIEKICAGKTPLMYAVKYGKLDMAKALVTAGANPNAENSKGKTALDYAKKYDQKALQSYLESF